MITAVLEVGLTFESFTGFTHCTTLQEHHPNMTSNLVVAAGFIIFRRFENQVQYLLLRASNGRHWTPPKGHVDEGEEEFETALRETVEEAGLKKEQLIIYEDYKKILKYDVRGKPKKVVYWLAELKKADDPVILSEEHTEYKWLQIKEACDTARFKEMEDALSDVDSYLNLKTDRQTNRQTD